MTFISPILLAIGMLLAISGLDFLTGSEISFSVFYFAPVALLAWRFERSLSALLMAACCAVAWYVVDDLGGRVYSSALIGVWNATLRLTSLTIIAVLVSSVRTARNRQGETNSLLQATVTELQESSRQITDLQSQMQTICAWTNRIQCDGKWMKFEEFMERNLGMQFSHGISKEALAGLYTDLGQPPAPNVKPRELAAQRE